MTAGYPNWIKLHEMGKLPKSARGNVPLLAQLDVAEKRIKELEEKICDDCKEKILGVKEPNVVNATNGSPIKVKCEVEGCEYVGEGRTEGIARNILRMHNKTHAIKE